MYNLLGTTFAALGNLDEAYEACSRELELNRSVGYDGYIASAEGNLAEVAMRLGDIPTAARHQKACLELAAANGSTAMVAFSLIVAARISGTSSNWPDALRLHAKGEQMLEGLGLVLYEDDVAESERLLAGGIEAIGAERADQEHAAGGSMTLTAAIDAANRVLDGAAHRG
jgi:tetratricopeptide (TPR) repeat protein